MEESFYGKGNKTSEKLEELDKIYQDSNNFYLHEDVKKCGLMFPIKSHLRLVLNILEQMDEVPRELYIHLKREI